MVRLRSFLALLPLLAFARSGLAGNPQDPNFAETVFASGNGLSDATGMCWATDGSNTLFVTQKGDGNGGHLRVILNGVLQAVDFATVNPVYLNSECGLDNVVVDPNYASNGYVFVFITESTSVQRVYRYTAGMSGGNLVGSNKTAIGPPFPTAGQNHDGGGMAIGPDGFLYIGVGNNGNGSGAYGNGTGRDGNADEFDTLASKITRIDRTTGAPAPGNAFAGMGSMGNYMFAKGMRNPFGLRFHPTTGDLWLTAVGDGYEQIYLVPPGGDEGWPTENNTSTTNGLLIPKFDYVTNNSVFGGALTRGIFYNGTRFPAAYQGNFFFCDYNAGQVNRAILDASGKNITSASVFVTGVGNIVDISVGPDGALYYVCRTQNNVYRLDYGGPQQSILTSVTSLTFNEGSSGTFGVHLAIQPPGPVTVNVARSSGNTNISAQPASLSFTTTNWNTDQPVTVNSVATPDGVNDDATITMSASGLPSVNVPITAIDQLTANSPTAKLFAPTNGQTVSGTADDFFGYGYPVAPATLVKAEFFIDGVLVWTDPYDPTVGHFHYMGHHASWDTTQLANGPHTLKMTVFDSNNLTGSDQITVTVDNTPTPPPGGGGGSGGGGGGAGGGAASSTTKSVWGCGTTGLEGILIVGLLGLGRRRTRRA
ncbi:MAG TPA: PQQ-dependent sugar dehydrogenase [Planctomycetota bacterium]|nr:PQQ-dependent sugar dehydrogenase [Planctomycetota bacterium]